MAQSHPTYFASLAKWEKGHAEIISGNVKHYVFSNMFDVASRSKPYEKVVVGKNLEYVMETLRAEGSLALVRRGARRVRGVHGRRGGSAVHQARRAEPRPRARKARCL